MLARFYHCARLAILIVFLHSIFPGYLHLLYLPSKKTMQGKQYFPLPFERHMLVKVIMEAMYLKSQHNIAKQ